MGNVSATRACQTAAAAQSTDRRGRPSSSRSSSCTSSARSGARSAATNARRAASITAVLALSPPASPTRWPCSSSRADAVQLEEHRSSARARSHPGAPRARHGAARPGTARSGRARAPSDRALRRALGLRPRGRGCRAPLPRSASGKHRVVTARRAAASRRSGARAGRRTAGRRASRRGPGPPPAQPRSSSESR